MTARRKRRHDAPWLVYDRERYLSLLSEGKGYVVMLKHIGKSGGRVPIQAGKKRGGLIKGSDRAAKLNFGSGRGG